ncbi:uncharacterized protein LOC132310133 [Cornus florida]|uniref:uncharacterized protein LOC132310133 n=1 Tax=Cornus florida TaxID=4283 RepID=UPI00289B4E36|nr:uncharacterized protein LOC132310133 [Cornus florida]
MELMSLQRNPRTRRSTVKIISLEDYVDFIDSQKQFDLTVNHLNQVIEMHGFKKIHKKPKKVLIDAVDAIELMDPSRSTLEDSNISSCAFITLEEAISDLADLNWQECCVTSIQTLNSVNYELVLHNADTSKPNAKSKPRRKIRKLKHIEDKAATTTAAADAATGGDADAGGLQSAFSSAIVEYDAMKLKLKRRRKKNVKNVDDGGFGCTVGGFSSSSSALVSVGKC